jgi:hypothetical protein
MATIMFVPRNLDGLTEVCTITGDFFSMAASITASNCNRSVMLNAPTAYPFFAASTMISFAFTMDIFSPCHFSIDGHISFQKDEG